MYSVERRSFLAIWARQGTSTLRNWWVDHNETVLRVAVLLMLVAALVWLGYQFWRLLWQPGPWGAVDLRILHELVHGWFAGRPVYSEVSDAIHPPATYAILWPLLGWLAVTPARWFWAVTTVAALGWLVYLVVQESHADTPLERAVVALMPLSMYATGAAIGNGQLIVHILPLLVAGLLLLQRRQRGWRVDLLAGALVLIAFVKPSISVPFFWILLFIPKSPRPALLVALGYVALTHFAVSFQEPDLTTLLRSWLARSSALAVTPGQGNVTNLHIWLGSLGLEEWILPTSLIVLLALGFWIYCCRHVDLWLILGVTGYVTRFWTYHRWYDDLLILLPMVALFRIAKQRRNVAGSEVMAGTLLAITMLIMLAPGGLFLFPPPLNIWYVTGQIMVWITGLIFLLQQAWQEKKHGPAVAFVYRGELEKLV
jgi:Glycosyltransferase family 87